jgi:uncharacterized 2Fe-2S/4Fe-4S cluster protein (DUF4445 family)
MTTHIVVFYPEGKCGEVETGESLLAVARQLGVALDSTCGGQGVCGKCRVIVRLGEVEAEEAASLSAEEKQAGYVLACRAKVIGDVVVEVPIESQRGELQILTGENAGLQTGAPEEPLAKKVAVELPAPAGGDNLDDLSRLLHALNEQQEGRLSPAIDLAALQALPQAVRAGDWKFEVLLGEIDERWRIIDILPAANDRPVYGLAVDIGTTTVVVQLVDLENGRLVGTEAALNEQISFGNDVISRIVASEERVRGLTELQNAIIQTLNKLIIELLNNHKVSPDQVICACCAGNTVMTQLLFGVAPGPLRRDPYVPAARYFPTVRGADLGLPIHPRGPVWLLPCISSYVGGDITAGVLATGMDESPAVMGLIDLGTNGEVAVGGKDWLVCTSCSAGPAFEGSGIKHGMYAGPGAIERAEYDLATDKMRYNTVGGGRPRGICGSGLVDALASLMRGGVIDRSGRIDLGHPTPRVRVVNHEPEFVLVWGEEAGREEDISLQESDIQNLIRSKAAVYAGLTVLLKRVGVKASELDQVLVAGAFGNYLDAENAVQIGLLPDLPLERIKFVGNSSVAGARKALLSLAARKNAARIAAKLTNFELSLEREFMEAYVAGLFLPHTDTSLFPSVVHSQTRT